MASIGFICRIRNELRFKVFHCFLIVARLLIPLMSCFISALFFPGAMIFQVNYVEMFSPINFSKLTWKYPYNQYLSVALSCLSYALHLRGLLVKSISDCPFETVMYRCFQCCSGCKVRMQTSGLKLFTDAMMGWFRRRQLVTSKYSGLNILMFLWAYWFRTYHFVGTEPVCP